jgi:hypothetical protein
MPRRVPALEKLEGLTGFRPSIPLTAIIDRVIEYQTVKRNPAATPGIQAGTDRPARPIAM